jgi:hypothetical protein
MIKKITTFFIFILLISCEKDLCDEGYTENENGICIPNYLYGINQNFELGEVYYHKTFGEIKNKNGKWFDSNDTLIKTLNN